jgi:hypothetical protein
MDFSSIVVPDVGDTTEDSETPVTAGIDANTILLASKSEPPILDEVHPSCVELQCLKCR